MYLSAPHCSEISVSWWLHGKDHFTAAVLFTRSDSKNDEHNLVRGKVWEGPLNMFSQGLSDGINVTGRVRFPFKSDSGGSP